MTRRGIRPLTAESIIASAVDRGAAVWSSYAICMSRVPEAIVELGFGALVGQFWPFGWTLLWKYPCPSLISKVSEWTPNDRRARALFRAFGGV